MWSSVFPCDAGRSYHLESSLGHHKEHLCLAKAMDAVSFWLFMIGNRGNTLGKEETVAIVTKWIPVILPGFRNIEKQQFREMINRKETNKSLRLETPCRHQI